jgi:ABC-type multidrug transport system ATPase subunit
MPERSPGAIVTESVSRRFGRQWAVRKVSVRLEAGALHVVIGHNGAGKSTLLGLLAGAMRPTEGHVKLLGTSFEEGGAALRRRVAWLPHKPFVYPDLTGREALCFAAELYGRRLSTEAQDALLDRVQLATSGHRKVRTYSRGMTQRLALAAVLAQQADVWLLDEPATGLDVSGRAMLLEVLSEAKLAGACLVVVTHDPMAFAPITDAQYRLERARLSRVEQG